MWQKIRVFFDLIKFEHTVFALPFAYLGMIVALKHWPSWAIVFWVTLAMAAARTTGMLLNRIVDKSIDERNPRTKNRPLITGSFKVSSAWIAVVVSAAIFFFSAYQLNPLCFKLSPVALFFLCTYHYIKRFSFLCHFVLGFVLAIAPIGGWLAVTGEFSWSVLPLCLAVMFWVAGFDILYSLQDIDFDRSFGLHSVPVKFGQESALAISRYCHLITVLSLGLFGVLTGLSFVYWAGVIVCAGLLYVEHHLLADGDLSKINTAFFTINGWMGILLFIFTYLDIF